MENKGQQFGSSMWRKGSQGPSSFERKYPLPSRASRPTGPKPSERTEKPETIDPWGTHQKIDMKIFSRGAKDRDAYSKTGVSEREGKAILEKHLGTGFVQKSAFKKVIQGLEAKSGHPLTEKEGIEARKVLKYLRYIEKSLEKK